MSLPSERIQPIDFGRALATGYALRNARLQNQSQEMELEQARQAFGRRQSFQDALKRGDMAGAQAADPQAFMGLQKQISEQRKNELEIQKDESKLTDERALRNQGLQQRLLSALASDPTPETLSRIQRMRDVAVQNGYEHFALPGEDAEVMPNRITAESITTARRAAGWKDPREEPTGNVKDFEYGQKNPEFWQSQIDLASAKAGQPVEVRTTGLRKEFFSLPDVKNYSVMQDSIGKVRAASSNGAGDIGLIFNYMKLLDPGSTVREGEFAQAVASGGVPSQITALFNKLQGNGVLDANTRNMVRTESEKIVGAQEQRYKKQESYFNRLARQNGLDPFQVTGFEQSADPRDIPYLAPADFQRGRPRITPQQAKAYIDELGE